MRVFDEIKAYVESGKNNNKFHSKEAVLFFFLDSYYQHDVYGCNDVEDVPEDLTISILMMTWKPTKRE